MCSKIAIIGAGVSGLSAAAYASKSGNEVYVFEKHAIPGGRARQFTTGNGYKFDMGPSWYWMPDIIDNFFKDFNSKREDYYDLISLNPQFEMIFEKGNIEIPRNYEELKKLFNQIETGSGQQLDRFMKAAKYKYDIGMHDFIEKPCHNWLEFFDIKIALSAVKLDILSNFRSYVAKYFKHPWLRAFMEFPVIFLGASPKNIPAMYSLMNYGGYILGTWYPKGGFFELILAMEKVCKQVGVSFRYNSEVEKILVEQDRLCAIQVNGETIDFDYVIASSDYHHTESLLDIRLRNYPPSYWQSRTFAPSCLIYYLGFNKLIPRLQHHTLFFESEFDDHIDDIYTTKKWPEDPLFYVCCPSKTDSQVAPEGHENVFMLMPLPIGVDDNESLREQYFQIMLKRLCLHAEIDDLEKYIDYKRSYCVKDFVDDYHAYQGNAYGLANTLKQTAVLKPSIRNKKISNLFYTGQLTVPGPGIPPAIISGKIVANELDKLNISKYEKAI